MDDRQAQQEQAALAPSGWLPITEFADGWQRMDDERGLYPPPRAGWNGGWIHVQVAVERIDGRDAVEGERLFRMPRMLRTGQPFTRACWILDQGMFRVEKQVIDADGWYLAPYVLLERPSTPEDFDRLDEVHP